MRHLSLLIALATAVGVVSGGAAARSAGVPVFRVRTLVTSPHWIYGFALGAHRITWISRTHVRGRSSGCEMYVRTLTTGRTFRAPLPSVGCVTPPPPPQDFAPQAPVLADGVAAWITGSSCGNNECFWEIATITGGEAKARIVESADFGCPGAPACLLRHRVAKAVTYTGPPRPIPALAGNGNLLVYSGGGANLDQVWRIVGRHTSLFAVPSALGSTGWIEGLTVGSGAVGVVSRGVDFGDGCGCLDAPAWSPDGSKIAYLHWTPARTQGAPAVMNADGSARRDLSPATPHPATEGPAWSPDGKQIAYGETWSKSQSEAIAVANADGSGAHEIGLGDTPTWSPDGSKIAFVHPGCGASGPTAAISVMNPDGTNVQQRASFGPAPACLGQGGIAWSPDGTRIAFSLNGTLEVMNADGSNPHPLTPGDEPAWSPDSSQIVFHTNSGLSLIGANGTGLRQLTQGHEDDHPSWSPDGKTILFSSERDNPYDAYYGFNYDYASPYALPELYLVDPDGSNLRPLSFTTPAAFVQQQTFYAANGKPLPSLPGIPTLAGNIAAIASTTSNGVDQITLVDATSGNQLAVIPVGTGQNPFTLAGADTHWIVFQAGTAISALNTHSHQIIRLTTAPAGLIDLSIAGRHVAWAENTNDLQRPRHYHHRIRTLELPN